MATMYGTPLDHDPAGNAWDECRGHPVGPPGLVLGLSLGGFVDAILVHPLIDWQQRLSGADWAAQPDQPWLNLLAEDLFRTAVWLLAVLGSVLLWRARAGLAAPGAGLRLLGTVLAGAGLFIAGDGILGAYVPALRPIGMADPWRWTLGLLALGAVLAGLGFRVWRAAPRDGLGTNCGHPAA